MAVIQINNEQISNSEIGNTYLGVDGSQKLQEHSVTDNKLANTLSLGNVTVANLTVDNTFIGDGSGLSNIQAANVVGTVSTATTATCATTRSESVV